LQYLDLPSTNPITLGMLIDSCANFTRLGIQDLHLEGRNSLTLNNLNNLNAINIAHSDTLSLSVTNCRTIQVIDLPNIDCAGVTSIRICDQLEKICFLNATDPSWEPQDTIDFNTNAVSVTIQGNKNLKYAAFPKLRYSTRSIQIINNPKLEICDFTSLDYATYLQVMGNNIRNLSGFPNLKRAKKELTIFQSTTDTISTFYPNGPYTRAEYEMDTISSFEKLQWISKINIAASTKKLPRFDSLSQMIFKPGDYVGMSFLNLQVDTIYVPFNKGAIQNVAPVLGFAYGKFKIPLLAQLQCIDNQEIALNKNLPKAT
jgi:hypothetical protein